MFDFIIENKEWLFSGIGVTLLLIIGAFVKRKFFGKKSDSKDTKTGHEITVHVHPHHDNGSKKGEDVIGIERISPLKFSEIGKRIDKAAPLQKDEIRKSFKGIKVAWDTYLKSASKDEKNIVTLWLSPGCKAIDTLCTIRCTVLLDDYPELGILPKGAKIRIQGKITNADKFDVELANVKLFFLEDK